MSMLTDVLTPLWRRRVYVVYGLLGLVTTCVQASYSAVNGGQPDALTVWLAIYGVLGTLVGATAASNVTVPNVYSEEQAAAHAEVETMPVGDTDLGGTP